MAERRRKHSATLKAVAARAGCSTSTAGYVLRDEWQAHRIGETLARRVRQAADELGYAPNPFARALKRRRSGLIGVVFHNLVAEWPGRVAQGLRDVLTTSGRDVFPFITTHQGDQELEAREIDWLLERRAEAILCVALNRSDNYRRVLDSGTPLIFLGDTHEDLPEANYVAWDSAAAARAATRRLIETGRRRIAFLGHRPHRPFMRNRFEGYKAALEEAGLAFRPEWVDWTRASWLRWTGHLDLIEGAMQRLFPPGGVDRPDALFVSRDNEALMAFEALRRLGFRIPDDVALMAMGDSRLSSYPLVGLSVVREPEEEIGRRAAEAALRLIEDPASGPEQIRVEGNEVVERATTTGGRGNAARDADA